MLVNFFQVWLDLYEILAIFVFSNKFIIKIFLVINLMLLIMHPKYEYFFIYLIKVKSVWFNGTYLVTEIIERIDIHVRSRRPFIRFKPVDNRI